MSVSKNVLSLKEKRNIIIIIGIHNCLNRDFFTKEELTIRVNEDLDDYGLKEIETYNKKYRTIEKGVKTIKETLKIEIEEKGKPVLYKYKANNVKIAKQLFLNSGMEHMVLMYDILLSLDGLSFSKFNEKILNSLDVKGYSKLKELKFYEDKDTINPLIQFESHSKFEIDQGDLFLELFDAINERKSLELKYKYFNEDNNKTYLVSPYLLKQFNKRWFLFVFNNEKKAIDYFGLARIQSIKVLSKDSFIETERKCLFGEESYFSDKVGVSKYINKYESLVENEICNVIIEIEKCSLIIFKQNLFITHKSGIGIKGMINMK